MSTLERLEPGSPDLSGERFLVAYSLTGSREQAAAMAADLCVEQTVEFPADLLPPGPIAEGVLGEVVSLTPRAGSAGGADRWDAVVSYAVETAGGGLPQLLNVIFGNTSLKQGVRVEGLELPPALLSAFPGPRFGPAGLRDRLGAPRRPLLCTALKPMGLSPRELAAMAHRLALGGMDIIKDDHGLADQPFAPFDERLDRCVEAVARANRQTGGRTLYIPNLSFPAHQVLERAHIAREAGAGGVMLAPGLVGWDMVRLVAGDQGPELPVLAHPALLGSALVNPEQGMAPRVLLGQLVRLCGADAVIFPHHGGRFPMSEQDCRDLVRGCTEPMGGLLPSLPVPAGGIALPRLPELHRFYGDDVMFLIGGDLHRGDDLVQSCRRFAELVLK